MSPSSDSLLDDLILGCAKPRWQKVAMVIAKTEEACRGQARDIDPEDIADRIVALVEAGRLEAQGNLTRWRYSEVRLAHDVANTH